MVGAFEIEGMEKTVGDDKEIDASKAVFNRESSVLLRDEQHPQDTNQSFCDSKLVRHVMASDGSMSVCFESAVDPKPRADSRA